MKKELDKKWEEGALGAAFPIDKSNYLSRNRWSKRNGHPTVGFKHRGSFVVVFCDRVLKLVVDGIAVQPQKSASRCSQPKDEQ